jgi:energy-converting hydrogenase Eha subunit E
MTMSSVLIFQIQTAVGLAICAFAIWKGGPPERLGAGLILTVVVLARIATALVPANAEPIVRLAGDGLTAVGLLAIALTYGSLWLGGVMLLYAAQFSLHSYYFVTNRPTRDLFHAVVNNIDFIGIILCLTIGTIVSWRRRVTAARTRAAALASQEG